MIEKTPVYVYNVLSVMTSCLDKHRVLFYNSRIIRDGTPANQEKFCDAKLKGLNAFMHMAASCNIVITLSFKLCRSLSQRFFVDCYCMTGVSKAFVTSLVFLKQPYSAMLPFLFLMKSGVLGEVTFLINLLNFQLLYRCAFYRLYRLYHTWSGKTG